MAVGDIDISDFFFFSLLFAASIERDNGPLGDKPWKLWLRDSSDVLTGQDPASFPSNWFKLGGPWPRIDEGLPVLVELGDDAQASGTSLKMCVTV